MFGGFDHLSAAAEAKARKGKGKGKKAGGSGGGAAADGANDGAEDLEDQERHKARLAAHTSVRAQLKAIEDAAMAEGKPTTMTEKEVTTALAELVLGADGSLGGKVEDPLPKDDFVCFFAAVHHKLWSLRARKVLAHFASDVRTYPQLSQTLVDMQKACFAEIGVDVEHGCGSLGAISMHYHRDNELLERQAAFMDLCRTAFLRAVQDARAIQLSQSTSGKLVLQSEGELSLPVIGAFADLCGARLSTEESRQIISEARAKAAAKAPNQIQAHSAAAAEACMKLQYEVFEWLGVEKAFGVQMLNKIPPKTLNSNPEVAQKIRVFSQACAQAVDGSAVSQAELWRLERTRLDQLALEREVEITEAANEGLQHEGAVSREKVMEFFDANQAHLDSPETRAKYKEAASTPKGLRNLNNLMVEDQKAQFAKVGLSRKLGNEILGNLQENFGDDEELMGKVKSFAMNCSSAWLQAVKDAKPTGSLQRSGKMTRLQIINFCDACTCSAAGTLSVTLQRNMIETLGCDANFGVSCLNKVGQDFAQDREVLQRMGNFQQAAQVTVKQSALSDEELVKANQLQAKERLKQEAKQAQMRERMQQVQLAVSEMSDDEKQKLKDRMGSKWATLMRLPQGERTTYMDRQPDTDQVDFAMLSQIMMQEKMQQAMLQQAGGSGASGGGGAISSSSGGGSQNATSAAAGGANGGGGGAATSSEGNSDKKD